MVEDSISAAGLETRLVESRLVAYQSPPYPVGSYILAGTLGMFLWDILIHLGTEYELLWKQELKLPTLIYLWSRLNTLFTLVSVTVFFTAPLDDYCSTVAKFMFCSHPTLVTSTVLLFLFRLHAIYVGNKRVLMAFSVSAVIVIGISTFIPFIGVGGRLGPQDPYCTIIKSNPQLTTAIVVVALSNSTAVFLAISIKLMPASAEETETRKRDGISRIRRFLRGKHLTGISRTLWQDGQKYLLVFLVTSLTMLVVLSANVLPPIYGPILVAPHTALENSMSSYLIRSLRASALRPGRNVNTTLNLGSVTELQLESRRDGQVLPR